MTICEECENCKWYWENNDTGEECEGSFVACGELIEIVIGGGNE